jgi:heat shock protein HtpX
MFRRIGFFLLTNILVILTIQIVIFLIQILFGVNVYELAGGNGYIIVFSLVWGMGGAFISLMLSKTMAKKMMGVQVVEENGQYAHLVRIVHQYAKQANLAKMPEVGIYQSPEVNAFATGPSKSNSLVAISTGLLQRMDQDEVEGVIAHEVGHIANGDMVSMTLLQGIINAFVIFFSRALAQILVNGDDEEGGSGGNIFAYYAVVIGLEIAFGILGSIVVAYFSRAREFRADSEGARLAGREKMIKALQRLQSQYELGPIDKRGEAIQSLKISNHGQGLMKLFSSHPSLERRIQALQYRA